MDLATLDVNPFPRRNPGLKSETWATHLMSGAALFSTERSAVAGSAVQHVSGGKGFSTELANIASTSRVAHSSLVLA
jgi:hypothetical protein